MGRQGDRKKAYTEMMREAGTIAASRMSADAERLGADAVICVRYTTFSIAQGAAQVIAYGTAVKYI